MDEIRWGLSTYEEPSGRLVAAIMLGLDNPQKTAQVALLLRRVLKPAPTTRYRSVRYPDRVWVDRRLDVRFSLRNDALGLYITLPNGQHVVEDCWMPAGVDTWLRWRAVYQERGYYLVRFGQNQQDTWDLNPDLPVFLKEDVDFEELSSLSIQRWAELERAKVRAVQDGMPLDPSFQRLLAGVIAPLLEELKQEHGWVALDCLHRTKRFQSLPVSVQAHAAQAIAVLIKTGVTLGPDTVRKLTHLPQGAMVVPHPSDLAKQVPASQGARAIPGRTKAVAAGATGRDS